MDLASLFLVLIALSAGAFLSAFSFGREAKKKEVPGRALICGSVFGVFEGFMPLVGFLAASLLGNTLGRFAHWVGFLLLSYLGLSLLIETLRRRRKAATPAAGWELKGLLLAALSASVDLLVAGLALALFGADAGKTCALAAAVGFASAAIGFFAGSGKEDKRYVCLWAGISGCVLIIGIALRLLLAHQFGV